MKKVTIFVTEEAHKWIEKSAIGTMIPAKQHRGQYAVEVDQEVRDRLAGVMVEENMGNFSDTIILVAMRYRRDAYVEKMTEDIEAFTKERSKK